MITLNNLPILELNITNIAQEWSNLIKIIRNSSFISIDLELSGLGNRKHLNKPSIDDRYKYLVELASSYSIISFGLSCFKQLNQDDSSVSYENSTFDVLCLCENGFKADFDSLKFHRKNKFDFNNLFSNGISYYRGKDCQKELYDTDYLRRLIRELALAQVPLVFHNGLVDLVFLYENFYDKLPEKFMTFVSEISDLFTCGVYDTKYVADFHARTNASYLEYLFRNCHYENTKKKFKNERHFVIEFTAKQEIFVDFRLIVVKNLAEMKSQVCKQYSSHGFCNLNTCKLIHSAHLQITIEVMSKKKKCQMEGESDSHESDTNSGIHSSSIDAFMTGYIFAYHKLVFKDIQELSNKLLLSGKNQPLLLTKSSFERTRARKEKNF